MPVMAKLLVLVYSVIGFLVSKWYCISSSTKALCSFQNVSFIVIVFSLLWLIDFFSNSVIGVQIVEYFQTKYQQKLVKPSKTWMFLIDLGIRQSLMAAILSSFIATFLVLIIKSKKPISLTENLHFKVSQYRL